MKCFVKACLVLCCLFNLTFSSFAGEKGAGLGDLEVYFENDKMEDVIPIYYNNRLYLPVFLKNTSWDKENNCLEIFNLASSDNSYDSYIPDLDISYVEIREDMRVTYNGTLINLKAENGAKLYPLSFNGYVYLPDCAFTDLFLMNLEFSNDGKRLDIIENDSVLDVLEEFLITVFSDNLIPNEEVTLTNQLESMEEAELFCNFVSDVYFYGDDPLELRKISLDLGSKKYSVTFVPYGMKDKINSNDGLTDYLFTLSDEIGIKDGMSDYDKVRLLNKWIINNYSYNVNSPRLFKDLIRGDIAVCYGYATLFHELAEFYGLDSEIVYGMVKSNGSYSPHAWNKLFLDGQWYHVDVCWNDSGNNSLEKFLLLSEREMFYYHNK